MTNEMLIAFLKSQIRLLETALRKSEELLIGVDRHQVFEYIGQNEFWCVSGISEEDHRAQNPLSWTEDEGDAIALDPIRNEIESMKETIKILTGEE